MSNSAEKPNPKVLFLDFFGVVVPIRKLAIDALSKQLSVERSRLLEVVFSDPRYQNLFIGQAQSNDLACVISDIVGKEVTSTEVEAAWNLEVPVPELAAWEFVKFCKGQWKQVALVSDMHKIHLRRLRNTSFLELFDAVITSCETGALKRSGRPYLVAIRQLRATPSQIVVVDDREGNLEVARDLGCTTVQHDFEAGFDFLKSRLISLLRG